MTINTGVDASQQAQEIIDLKKKVAKKSFQNRLLSHKRYMSYAATAFSYAITYTCRYPIKAGLDKLALFAASHFTSKTIGSKLLRQGALLAIGVSSEVLMQPVLFSITLTSMYTAYKLVNSLKMRYSDITEPGGAWYLGGYSAALTQDSANKLRQELYSLEQKHASLKTKRVINIIASLSSTATWLMKNTIFDKIYMGLRAHKPWFDSQVISAAHSFFECIDTLFANSVLVQKATATIKNKLVESKLSFLIPSNRTIELAGKGVEWCSSCTSNIVENYLLPEQSFKLIRTAANVGSNMAPPLVEMLTIITLSTTMYMACMAFNKLSSMYYGSPKDKADKDPINTAIANAVDVAAGQHKV